MIFINEETEFIADGQDAAVDEMDQLILEEGITLGDDFSAEEMGAVEICLEMETSWAALVQDMGAIEHKSIVNEDAGILTEGLKSWWTAIINFFKRVWAAISSWFKKAWDWITRRFQNAEKWYKANVKKITATSTKYSTYPFVANKDDVTPKQNKLINMIKNAKTREEVSKLGITRKILMTDMLGATERKEMTVTKAAVEYHILGGNAWLAALKGAHNVQAAALKGGISFAQQGLRTADDKAAAGLKEKVEATKAKLTALKLLDAQTLRAYNFGISDAFAVAKKLLRESKAAA